MASLNSTFGATLVAIVVEATLYGITLLQTFFYFRKYHSDHWFTKSLVIILTFLDTLHLVLALHTVYWYLVTNFGNSDNLNNSVWSLNVQTDCQTFITVIVECFFARRLWLMGKNWLLVTTIVVMALLQIIAVIIFTIESFRLVQFAKFTTLTWEICLGLGASVVGDVIIAASMCYYLYRRRTGLGKTDSVVTMLMVYSVNSGVLTSIVALLSLILFLAMPTNLVWISVFFLLGKCYVNAFLGLLNSREQLRSGLGGIVTLSEFAGGLDGSTARGAARAPSGDAAARRRRVDPLPDPEDAKGRGSPGETW
ncbi:uncharacterized protein BXZ73DRAFT_101215 [Epithele typhae]|uniref:uncharacterized protein n=1 Tax=Epithele typhae TaxID=378194 RepID=UPI0020074579|nr:uncharacterized protein BXZ73DRAFT_101215 [Epithele typhae]KAH9933255.1 hypothetical protein BXZ73DRAFT_101215 [Epithele typhae]